MTPGTIGLVSGIQPGGIVCIGLVAVITIVVNAVRMVADGKVIIATQRRPARVIVAVVTLGLRFDKEVPAGIGMTVLAGAWRDTRPVPRGCRDPGSSRMTTVTRLACYHVATGLACRGSAVTGKTGAWRYADVTEHRWQPGPADGMTGLTRLRRSRVTRRRFAGCDGSIMTLRAIARCHRCMVETGTGPDIGIVTEVTGLTGGHMLQRLGRGRT